MAEIPISGVNGEAIIAIGTDIRHIMEDDSGNSPDFDGVGRIFELLGIVVTNSHASTDGTFRIYDQDESTTGTGSNQQLGIILPYNNTRQLEWRHGAGPKFSTNICATLDAGTIAALAVQTTGRLI
jgi:hypothetical protein